MANPWCRLYSEFADDPKVQMLPEAMQRRLIMLFCSRCKGETLPETALSFYWRVSEADVQKTKAAFIANGFIDDEWNLLNWDRRQFISDSSTDRVKAHRERKKRDETFLKQDVTENGTPPDTDTEQIQSRTDSDSEHIHIQKKQKPRRGKRDSNESPLFAQVKQMVFLYYRQHNETDPAWDGSEAKQLSSLLAAQPGSDIAYWQTCMIGRHKSEVNHAERPRTWLAKLSSYRNPVDSYNRPKDNPDGTPRRTVFQTQSDRNLAAAREFLGDPNFVPDPDFVFGDRTADRLDQGGSGPLLEGTATTNRIVVGKPGDEREP